LPLLLGLAVLGVAAGATDLLHRRLPDALTLPAAPAAVLAAVPLGAAPSGRAVLGAVALCGAHVLVRAAAPGSLGAGDVKLAGPVGAALAAASWPALAFGCALASLFTLSAALAGWLCLRRPVRDGLPHGPSMLLASWLVCLAAAVHPALTGAPR
jgi:leader peptidase (prepilin peptidase)/N-methyltransferase